MTAPVDNRAELLTYLSSRNAKSHSYNSIAELVDKAMADELLKHNRKNRKLKRPVIDKMIIDLRAGNFTENGSCILIGDNGDILDGQNRLTAVSESGISARFILVVDVPHTAMKNIDTGAGRSLCDNFVIDGVSRASRVSQLVGKGMRWKGGDTKYTLWYGSTKNVTTRSQEDTFYSSHKDLIDQVVAYNKVANTAPVDTTSVIDMFRFLTLPLDWRKSDEFVDKFVSGNDLSENSPILAARNRITVISKGKRDRFYGFVCLYIMCHAWNLWVKGSSVSTIREPNPTEVRIKHPVAP
jgi:hypothetical protein